jgi:hypothetical protein
VLPFRSLVALATVAFVGSLPAVAHAQLNVICSASAELCRLLADEFQRETSIKAMLVVKVSRAYPANSAVASSPLAPKWSDIKFIDYDIAKYEKSPMRKKLTERWTAEVGASAH